MFLCRINKNNLKESSCFQSFSLNITSYKKVSYIVMFHLYSNFKMQIFFTTSLHLHLIRLLFFFQQNCRNHNFDSLHCSMESFSNQYFVRRAKETVICDISTSCATKKYRNEFKVVHISFRL